MRACLIATLLVPLMLAGGARAAEPFCPESAIKIVAPFPPGGPTDITARLLGERLREQFGQNVIVESRAGASGAIGTAYVAQQPGNGCTILLSYDTHAVNPAVYPLTFDTVTAFKPVMLIGTIPNAVAVHASQPWQTFDQLMAAAKSGRLVYASGASAGVAHFSMKLIEQLYGVEMQHVPYKGGAPAVQDLFGGHVPIMIGSVFALAPGVQDGRARALVQTGARRHPLMPDVPTVAEFGHPGFNTASWMGIFLPAGASDALVTRLHDALALALKNQTVRDRLTTLGVELAGSSPEELGAFVKAEIARWTDVVKRYDIKAD
ncbi:MAG TPA: tripartite tricarboxylate transporter substrate binding protein [Xanthobacteraceae bacterium]|nr:tripartite tricarboxylate transporter substrate binding protein [Xanthobacteraceae bacterium]